MISIFKRIFTKTKQPPPPAQAWGNVMVRFQGDSPPMPPPQAYETLPVVAGLVNIWASTFASFEIKTPAKIDTDWMGYSSLHQFAQVWAQTLLLYGIIYPKKSEGKLLLSGTRVNEYDYIHTLPRGTPLNSASEEMGIWVNVRKQLNFIASAGQTAIVSIEGSVADSLNNEATSRLLQDTLNSMGLGRGAPFLVVQSKVEPKTFSIPPIFSLEEMRDHQALTIGSLLGLPVEWLNVKQTTYDNGGDADKRFKGSVLSPHLRDFESYLSKVLDSEVELVYKELTTEKVPNDVPKEEPTNGNV